MYTLSFSNQLFSMPLCLHSSALIYDLANTGFNKRYNTLGQCRRERRDGRGHFASVPQPNRSPQNICRRGVGGHFLTCWRAPKKTICLGSPRILSAALF
jgi:hypothetical protein